MDDIDIPNEYITNISSILLNNEVKMFKKETDIYDIVNSLLEKNQSEEPFFIVNLGDIVRQYKKWMTYLPNVKPFYAVKCNPDPVILRLLADLNINFDCASQNEIAKIINMKVDPSRIIFANPCKWNSQIKFSRAHDVDLLTFDSENELYKIKLYHPEANLLLRIKTDDSKSMCAFSCKFGVDMDEVKNILSVAKGLKINVSGISFHCGSGCKDPGAFTGAIKNARQIFDIAKDMGFKFDTLNLGGGFPGVDTEIISFKDIAETINIAINEYFSNIEGLKLIAEPGRFFVASSHTLVMSVINKKVKTDENGEKIIIYYCNDSVYNNLNNLIMDHFVVNENNLFPFNERHEKKYKSVLYGGSCDSLDIIAKDIQLPDLSIGESCYLTNVGAYCVVWLPKSQDIDGFNGFQPTISKYVLT